MTMPQKTGLNDDSSDGRDSSHRWVTLHDDGRLSIEGQDLGPKVEAFFGVSEYEFARTVAPEGVARLRELLGIGPGDDLLQAIRTRFDGPGASHRLEQFVQSSGVASSFWSRHGD
ncbi:MAG TPA: hypothetical protein VL120_09850 [Solirubrobacteraceae bacterium]|nr:hypothetical protein [Solirubrobacteraceae bacterium]